MHQETLFFQAMIYLAAAVISVPIAKKIGLGSVLGYLVAGILIGPYVLKLVGHEGADVMHFAEFGVVIMLFLIGLELHPSMLWRMKRLIFGLGGLQVGITAFIVAIVASFFWLNTAQAITTGLIFSLSSTAIVLQTLSEKKRLQTRSGKYSFSVLLLQDIMVIPILAILALFANQVVSDVVAAETTNNHIYGGQGWQRLLLIITMVAVIIVGGRFLARYAFRFIAESGLREIFTASALLLVIGISLAMNFVGLSPALGSFLAGVVLANNEYRHELESNLEPFKGLLLGVFFISVGASIDFTLLMNHSLLILSILGALIFIKLTVLFILGRIFKLNPSQNMFFTFSLAQAGEFGFVLISFASQNAIYDTFTSGILLIVVALSMLLTPLLFIINEKWIQPYFNKTETPSEETIEENGNPVIIAGFGRLGMVLGRFLNANGIKSTILDNNPHNVQYLKKFGYKVYYGDVTRSALLESAGIMNAKVLVMAMGDREQINQLVVLAQEKYPHLKLIVRAVDIAHALELQNKGVQAQRQETFETAVELGADALQALGMDSYRSKRLANTFKYLDNNFMRNLQKRFGEDDPHFIMETRKFSEHLENILLLQQKHPGTDVDCAWDKSSLIEEAENQLSNAQEEPIKEKNE